jgi:hypothetical protein
MPGASQEEVINRYFNDYLARMNVDLSYLQINLPTNFYIWMKN